MNEESDDHAEEEEEPAPDGGREDDVVDVVECSCGAQLGLEPGDGPTVTCPSCSSTIPVGDDVGVCSSCEAVLEIEATDPGRISCPACGAQQVRA